MNKALNILYVGSLGLNSNSLRRFNTLSLLGHHTRGINIDPLIFKSAFSRLHYHFNFGPGVRKLNKEILSVVKSAAPDLLLIDNKPFVTSSTLLKVRKLAPNMKIVNLITDDPTGQYRYAWSICLKSASLYDYHFVQREVNVNELKAEGANKVEICYRSYDPSFHRHIELNDAEKATYGAEVGFIGTYEANREAYIAYLIENGIPVSVTGDGWPGGKHWNLIKPYYKGPSVYGEPYVKSINGMKIALHFLRQANRDEQDSRSFEIPACGVFMLAESSALHRALYEDGKEAVFFQTKEEMLEKLRYYLAHNQERDLIAKRGAERGKISGYDHTTRLKSVIDTVFQV
jgi:spore maturation protein CgeB